MKRIKWKIYTFVMFKCAYWDRGWRKRFLPVWDAIMDKLEAWGWESPVSEACNKMADAMLSQEDL